MKVEKRVEKSSHRRERVDFLAHNGLSKEEMVYLFLQGEALSIQIAYVYGGEGEEDSLEETIFSQTCKLAEDEHAYLHHILSPMNVNIWVPFITRLTRSHSNTERREMVGSLNIRLL
jgi:hypothetical protein